MCQVITISEAKLEQDNNNVNKYIAKVFSSDGNVKIVGENLTNDIETVKKFINKKVL